MMVPAVRFICCQFWWAYQKLTFRLALFIIATDIILFNFFNDLYLQMLITDISKKWTKYINIVILFTEM